MEDLKIVKRGNALVINLAGAFFVKISKRLQIPLSILSC